MSSREVRKPGKQGSWYLGDADNLSDQLEGFLKDVPNQIDGSDVPIPRARVIIAPLVPTCPIQSPDTATDPSYVPMHPVQY